MKKAALILAVAVLVLAVSVFWFRNAMSVSDAAELLPSETVAVLSLPDLPRTSMRWPKTTLALIGAEPEVTAFLEKPLAKLSGQPGHSEAETLLRNLKLGRLFLAIPSIEKDRPHALLGFQYWGGKPDFDAAVARLRRQVYNGKPPEPVRETVQGAEITTTRNETGEILYSGTSGKWGFLSNDLPTISDALARASGKSPSPALNSTGDFQAAVSQLPSESDVVAFVRPGPILDALLAIGSSLGASPDEAQISQARKAKAVSFATKLDGSDIHDAIFVLCDDPPLIGELTHLGMPLTNPATLAYFNQSLPLDFISEITNNPKIAELLAAAPENIRAIITEIPNAIGAEAAISLSWSTDSMFPEPLGVLTLKDPSKAEQLLMQAAALLPETTVSEVDGHRLFGFPSLRTPFIDPTVAISDNQALASLHPSSIQLALTRNGGETLEASPAFASARPAFQSANETFGFIDTKAVFQRAFPMLRQMILFGAAMMPGASDVLDTTKLPQTETLAKHLTPMTYSRSRLDNGYLIESSGPITMNQAAFLAAGAAIGILAPQLQQQ